LENVNISLHTLVNFKLVFMLSISKSTARFDVEIYMLANFRRMREKFLKFSVTIFWTL